MASSGEPVSFNRVTLFHDMHFCSFAAKLAPVAFNIKKLSIVCVVEDDKVSIEELTEKIEQFEDFVQSVDIAGFNKI